MDRRSVLKALGLFGGALLPAAPALARVLGQPAGAHGEGPGEPFSYAWLKGMARHFAGQRYHSHRLDLPPAIDDLSWDQYQGIQYRDDEALWADDRDAAFRMQFFHLGLNFHTPVKMHEVVDGRARPIPYRTDLFDFSHTDLDTSSLPEGLGFAGFRLLHHSDWERDIAAFLGASYFRATSASLQFGLSARGLAVNTAMSEPEEFPEFTHFWLERPADADQVIVYAFLDSPSVTGAYRFIIERVSGDVIMDVDAALYPRKPIERLGVAPLTSMYQVGENSRRVAWDWRPEIHDSDGLAIHTGGGEWIWRPLANPPQLRFNAFALAQDNLPGLFAYAVLAIGVIEEAVKMIPFLLVVVRFREFDEPIDGIIYASFIALGFATMENIQYLHGAAGPVHDVDLAAVVSRLAIVETDPGEFFAIRRDRRRKVRAVAISQLCQLATLDVDGPEFRFHRVENPVVLTVGAKNE